LSAEEVSKLGFAPETNFLKIITARDMNARQRKVYDKKRS